MSFSGDMRRFVAKTAAAQDKITRAATLELFSGVIRATPVDTGRARGGWQTGVGSAPEGDNKRLDKSAAKSIAEVEQNTPAGAGQVTYLANNVPYIMNLEQGTSKQAPEGMVRKNVDRVQKMVDAAIRKNKV